MKILTTADWHLRNSESYGDYNSSGVNSLFVEKLRVINDILDKAEELKSHLVIGGDMLDESILDSITLYYTSAIMKKMQNIKEVIL